jgi:hypothetical protein
MLPIILALAGGYLIVDSQKDKLKFEDGGMMAKGGIYSSDEPYIIDIIVDDKVVKSQTIRARNQKEANEIALDDEYEVTRKYGDHETKVYLAPPKMADGGTMAKGGSVKEEIEIKGHKIKHIKNSYDDYWYFVYQSTPFEFETKEEAVKSLNGLIKTNPYADGGMMAKGGETFRENEKVSVRIKPNEFAEGRIVRFDNQSGSYVISLKDKYESQFFDSKDIKKMADGGVVDKELIDSSAKDIFEQKGMMGLRNTFLQVAKTDEDAGDKKTAEYRRKVVSEYQSKQPKFMAKGGKMAKGGEIEEGDYVFVKPEKLNGEVIRITGENVVVEFTNRRPQSGDKRRNYKIKDLRKMAKGGKMAKGAI